MRTVLRDKTLWRFDQGNRAERELFPHLTSSSETSIAHIILASVSDPSSVTR